jgi:2-C-methyl-D-erythritol 2,4-cyclodiphosphate synthase
LKLDFRIGFGIDVHRLEEGREFWLGGILLPCSFGPVGHSDADVLIHAICDALLGALNLRDIGFHFSDIDPKYKGIDSKILLSNVMQLIWGNGYVINNIDSTIILEKPKVNPHIEQMQEVLCDILKIEFDQLSIKATTHEKVDSFGQGQAIKAYATCLVRKLEN